MISAHPGCLDKLGDGSARGSPERGRSAALFLCMLVSRFKGPFTSVV
jgi:hypothetical protein